MHSYKEVAREKKISKKLAALTKRQSRWHKNTH